MPTPTTHLYDLVMDYINETLSQNKEKRTEQLTRAYEEAEKLHDGFLAIANRNGVKENIGPRMVANRKEEDMIYILEYL